MKATRITIAGEEIDLLPLRAMYWPRERTLIVADVHLGKEEAFRAASIPVPLAPGRADLQRLNLALQCTGAERLLVLGDLWHASAGMVEPLLGDLFEWRKAWPDLMIQLVRGNHDQRVSNRLPDLQIQVLQEPAIQIPFIFQHYPIPSSLGYVLAGHIHPAVILRGEGRQRLRLPCFSFGENVGVLPAFGNFTGSAEIVPRMRDRVYVIAEGEIIEVRG
jgi:DNA ligase-associated metallophosphoesterase